MPSSELPATVTPPRGSWLARLRLRRCAAVGESPRVAGRVWVHGGGRIVLGDRVTLDASSAPIELHAGPGAEIAIGDDAVVHGGSSIEAVASVTIGPRARVGAYAKILDNHFHPLAGDRTRQPPSLPVVIEADVELGERCIVLPGARVATGTCVRPGTLVRGRPIPRAQRDAHALAPAETPLRGVLARLRADPVDTLRRVLALARACALFHGCVRGERVYAFGHVHVDSHGRVQIGDRVTFLAGMIPTELVCHPGGEIVIGEQSGFNYGASIEAHEAVRIGRRCMIASFVRLCDREQGRSGPIVVGDDVWIAHGATVLPGVTIGDGSVVSAGAVVVNDVPPGSLAIGNPAHAMSLALITAKPGTPRES